MTTESNVDNDEKRPGRMNYGAALDSATSFTKGLEFASACAADYSGDAIGRKNAVIAPYYGQRGRSFHVIGDNALASNVVSTIASQIDLSGPEGQGSLGAVEGASLYFNSARTAQRVYESKVIELRNKYRKIKIFTPEIAKEMLLARKALETELSNMFPPARKYTMLPEHVYKKSMSQIAEASKMPQGKVQIKLLRKVKRSANLPPKSIDRLALTLDYKAAEKVSKVLKGGGGKVLGSHKPCVR
jgi:hypothetical protein